MAEAPPLDTTAPLAAANNAAPAGAQPLTGRLAAPVAGEPGAEAPYALNPSTGFAHPRLCRAPHREAAKRCRSPPRAPRPAPRAEREAAYAASETTGRRPPEDCHAPRRAAPRRRVAAV